MKTDHTTTSAALFTPRTLLLLALVAGAVAVRLVIHFLPGYIPYNFSPVEAIALFGGALFLDRRLALVVPLVAMLASDLIIGLHGLLPVVYALIAATVWLGGAFLRGRARPLRIALTAIGASTLFFIVTNFAVWAMYAMYPHTAEGLLACYVAAIPFYKTQLAGTLLWSGALFGSHALLTRRFPLLGVPRAAH